MPVAAGKRANPYNFRFIQDDPLKVARILWPKDRLTREQEEIAYSVWFNKETYVKAANKMGKDFIAGLIIPVAFLTRWPCRIVTTSTKDDHLDVLWGEIHHRIQTSKIPLTVDRGGPLVLLQREIRKVDFNSPPVNGKRPMCAISYVKSMVANEQSMDAMGGHHATPLADSLEQFADHGVEGARLPYLYDWYTMWVADEASGIREEYYPVVRGWARRLFVFGNTWPGDNPFKWAFKGRPGTDDKGGDIENPFGDNYIRKCLSLPVSTSPNIRFARAQIIAGKKPTGEILVPGVKTWQEFVEEDATWDPIEKCVRHDAEWYEGKEVRLFPQEWLDRAVEIGRNLRGAKRVALAMGVDPAEGGDKTCFCVIDQYGIVELISVKTPDTADITDMTKLVIDRYGLNPRKCFFDSGGGGKQHVDRLRREGYPVVGVAFAESVVLEPKRSKRLFDEKVDLREDKGAYSNRRGMMYGEAAILLDPVKPVNRVSSFQEEEREEGISVQGIQMFGIPPDGVQYGELLRQLAAMPKKYVEGKLYLPPKSRKGEKSSTGEKTLTELLGRSPDEADAFVLAVYAMTGKRSVPMVRGYS